MLLPFMGLLIFFVPMISFALGIALCCFKDFRFLAPFAFLVPPIASYGALGGLWAVGIEMDRFGVKKGTVTDLIPFAGFLLGGSLGLLIGSGLSFGVLRIVRRLAKTSS